MITRSKRFWDKIRRDKIKNINMRGTSFTLFTGMKMPTHEQMNKMDKHDIIYDVDQEIRDAIIDLNEHGFKTLGSCAGHKPNKLGGFISIEGHPTVSKIKIVKEILRKHGLKRVGNVIDQEQWWSVHFLSIGVHPFRSIYTYNPKTNKLEIRNSKNVRK